jgi:hypothetical protein
LDGKKYLRKRANIQCKFSLSFRLLIFFRISKGMLKIGILMNALYLKCGKIKMILNAIDKKNYFKKCF